MVTKNADQIVWRRATFLFGTVDVTAATAVGYVSRSNGVAVTATKTSEPLMVEDLDGPLDMVTVERGLRLRANLVQFDIEALALALGIAAVGQVITVGGSGLTDEKFSAKVVAQDRGGTSLTFNALRVISGGETEMTFTMGALTEIPLDLIVLDADAGGGYTITRGVGNLEATLSTGVLTRVIGAGYHMIASEVTDAADILTSITAGDLVNLETLRLQIRSINEPITLTHSAGDLVLTGAVDWVMEDLDDYIDLVYTTAGTVWTETSRHDAP